MRAIKNGINAIVVAWCKWTFCRLPSSSSLSELSITSRGVLRVLDQKTREEKRGETRCFYDFSPTLTTPRLVLPVKNLLFFCEPTEWGDFIAPLPFAIDSLIYVPEEIRISTQQQQQACCRDRQNTMRAHNRAQHSNAIHNQRLSSSFRQWSGNFYFIFILCYFGGVPG